MSDIGRVARARYWSYFDAVLYEVDYSDGLVSHHERDSIIRHVEPPIPTKVITCEFYILNDAETLCECTSLAGELIRSFTMSRNMQWGNAVAVMEETLAIEFCTVTDKIQLISSDGLLIKDLPENQVSRCGLRQDILPSSPSSSSLASTWSESIAYGASDEEILF